MSALPCLIAIISIPNYVPNHQYGYRLRHWLHKISIFCIKNFLYSSSADGRHACICNIWWRIIDYYFFVNQFFSLNVKFSETWSEIAFWIWSNKRKQFITNIRHQAKAWIKIRQGNLLISSYSMVLVIYMYY